MGKGAWGGGKVSRGTNGRGKTRLRGRKGKDGCQEDKPAGAGTPDEHQSWKDVRGGQTLPGSARTKVNQQIAALLLD